MTGALFAVVTLVSASTTVVAIDGGNDLSTDAAITTMLSGGYLLAGFLLHERGWRGAATPFFGVGLALIPVATIEMALSNSQRSGGVIAFLLGAEALLVGSRCHRRASTWAGAGALVIAAVVVVADTSGNNPGTTAIALTGLAAAMVALGLGLERSHSTPPPQSLPPPEPKSV